MMEPEVSMSAHEREYRALLAVAGLITKPNLDYVLGEILAITIEALNATKGSIFLFEPNTNYCRRFILQRNLSVEMSRTVVQRVLDNGLAGWVVREKRGTVISDVAQDKRWVDLPQDDQSDIHSAICVPLMLQDHVLGVMTIVSSTVNHFQQSHLELAMAIANQSSMVIYNANLFEESREQEQRLVAILQNVGEPLLMLSEDFRLMLANHEAQRLLNRNLDSLTGEHISHVSDNPMWTALSQRLLEMDSNKTLTVFELHDPEAGRDFSVNVSPVVVDDDLVGFVIVFTDITSMLDLSRLKSHMLRMASHDLKNPLNIAVGYITLIQNDMANDVPIDAMWIEEIYQALIRMDSLIDELLDEQRIERESRFRSGSIDMHALIQAALNEILSMARQKQQDLQVELASEIPIVQGDQAQLRQAMINYLSNAIKYTPEGGQIKIAAYADESRFHFVVEDNGIGIPTEMQDNIFQQGYRAERDAISDIKGNGVGLSLVAEICRRHRGRAWFESEAGVGSRFGFWIPINQIID